LSSFLPRNDSIRKNLGNSRIYSSNSSNFPKSLPSISVPLESSPTSVSSDFLSQVNILFPPPSLISFIQNFYYENDTNSGLAKIKNTTVSLKNRLSRLIYYDI
jgi:hypothetical protein